MNISPQLRCSDSMFLCFINLSEKNPNNTKTTEIGGNKKPKQFDLLDIEVRYSSIQRLTREQNTKLLYIKPSQRVRTTY